MKRMPPKCKDTDVFTVPSKLGNLHVPRAMLDLVASINVLPYSIYESIGVGMLSKTGVIIQRANSSIVHPKGVLKDMLVQVNELVFLAYFYVLDMGDDDSPNFEFDGEVINFNTFEEKRYPSDAHSLNFVDIIQPLTEECFELTNHDFLELVLNRKFDKNLVKEILDDELLGIVAFMNDKKNMVLNKMGILWKVMFQELEEFRNKAFKNSYNYKNKTKAFYEKYISYKSFETGQKYMEVHSLERPDYIE
uniref:Uncharacterized protein n=1 Tax=Lactuca sativa TaxID=4236 RepID=A0A9R1VB78_LACSA|nr:hypothetical protein LSAT_V11C500279120 [Lactuca sativa]